MALLGVLTLLLGLIFSASSNDEPIQNYSCHYTTQPGVIDCEITVDNKTVIKEYENPEEMVLDISSLTFWFDLGCVIALTCTAGLVSGLTIGLMSLDKTQLEILRKSGTPTERQQASRILPLINRHHLLLVTLLLMNALANEALPIFLERLVAPVYAVLLGVILLLFFGEIIPMALFTKWGLAMGASVFWVVWILIAVCFVVAWPISKVLDFLLGAHENIKLFKRMELKELMNLHGASLDGDGREDALSQSEITIIKGAIDLKHKSVLHCGTPLKKTFMLSINDDITPAILAQIAESGHTRIPIYREVREQIVGVILVKNLLLLDRTKPNPIASLQITRLPNVTSNLPLFDMLNLFQTGRSHMALIVDEADQLSPLGIITLEDVLEELIQADILDETDKTATPRPGALLNESDDEQINTDDSTDSTPLNDDDDHAQAGPSHSRKGKGPMLHTDPNLDQTLFHLDTPPHPLVGLDEEEDASDASSDEILPKT